MVIGNGLMAQAFKAYQLHDGVVIFASGVSNSNETNTQEFQREVALLKSTINQYPQAKLVYFSTCSIEDNTVKDNLYVKHKLAMEHFIVTHCSCYVIFRVSNVVGAGGNANTLLNYLVHAIQADKVITLWNQAERNILDIADVCYIVEYILEHEINNTIVNVAFRDSFLVTDIVKTIEQFLGKTARVHAIDKGNPLTIDTGKIAAALDQIEQQKPTDLNYIMNLLKKYYTQR